VTKYKHTRNPNINGYVYPSRPVNGFFEIYTSNTTLISRREILPNLTNVRKYVFPSLNFESIIEKRTTGTNEAEIK
jgi:hypothetical protein